MTISLVEVTLDNWEDVIDLDVREEQAELVGSNVRSLAEASVRQGSLVRGISSGERIVGFVMAVRETTDGLYHVHRLMVDARYQGAGFGRAGLLLIIETIRRQPDYQPPVMIEFIAGNTRAEALYVRVGFRDTGVRIPDPKGRYVEKLYELASDVP
jgi:diamine N-acetyltransferase